MSVPEPLRHKGRLEVHVKAQTLAVHTLTVLGNEKIFDPSVDVELIRRIKSCALDIDAKLWSANKIRADTNHVNRELRYRLQEEAILLCSEMLAYIGTAKRVWHVRSRKIKYWGSLITEVQALAQAWKESDVARYGQP